MNEEIKTMIRDIAENLAKKFQESLEEDLTNAALPGTKIEYEEQVFVVRYQKGGLGCDICHFGKDLNCPRNEYGKTKCGDMRGAYLEKKA